MFSVDWKLGFPTGTLKQKFWGNESLILGTKESHVLVLGISFRFWKREAESEYL